MKSYHSNNFILVVDGLKIYLLYWHHEGKNMKKLNVSFKNQLT